MGKLIQRRRIKGWRKPEGAINCARPSPWSNPFTREWCRYGFYDKEEWTFFWRQICTKEFEGWLRDHDWRDGLLPERRQWILTHLHELAGDDVILMCWCGDSDRSHDVWESGDEDIYCHGVVLLNMANDLFGHGGVGRVVLRKI